MASIYGKKNGNAKDAVVVTTKKLVTVETKSYSVFKNGGKVKQKEKGADNNTVKVARSSPREVRGTINRHVVEPVVSAGTVTAATVTTATWMRLS